MDDKEGTSSCVEIAKEIKGNPTAPAQSRELQFSPCSHYIHLLCVSFKPTALHTECHVTLATYKFTQKQRSTYKFDSSGDGFAADFTYRFAELLATLPAPFIMTYWTPKSVVLALPPLTYNPKIVKLSLNVEGTMLRVATLTSPIFFPASSIWRKPYLMYSDGDSADDDSHLYLTLDASSTGSRVSTVVRAGCGRAGCKNAKPVSASGPGQDPSSGNVGKEGSERDPIISPPVVLRWKMAGAGKQKKEEIKRADNEEGSEDAQTWRGWNAEEDSTSEDVKAGRSVADEIRMLRGDFVIGKKYLVPYRSGLDWTRQGVLSCA